jgi:hypothetical protein
MNIDLEQSAHVAWLPDPPSTDGKLSGAPSKYFDHLYDALRFVVESVDPNIRQNAWIIIDGGKSLRGDAITSLYKSL